VQVVCASFDYSITDDACHALINPDDQPQKLVESYNIADNPMSRHYSAESPDGLVVEEMLDGDERSASGTMINLPTTVVDSEPKVATERVSALGLERESQYQSKLLDLKQIFDAWLKMGSKWNDGNHPNSTTAAEGKAESGTIDSENSLMCITSAVVPVSTPDRGSSKHHQRHPLEDKNDSKMVFHCSEVLHGIINRSLCAPSVIVRVGVKEQVPLYNKAGHEGFLEDVRRCDVTRANGGEDEDDDNNDNDNSLEDVLEMIMTLLLAFVSAVALMPGIFLVVVLGFFVAMGCVFYNRRRRDTDMRAIKHGPSSHSFSSPHQSIIGQLRMCTNGTNSTCRDGVALLGTFFCMVFTVLFPVAAYAAIESIRQLHGRELIMTICFIIFAAGLICFVYARCVGARKRKFLLSKIERHRLRRPSSDKDSAHGGGDIL
jgi:hypothetical protein